VGRAQSIVGGALAPPLRFARRHGSPYGAPEAPEHPASTSSP